ncbi:MAG TPA: FtsQ-type POTRA domain-containing protein, partial [bacterium]|nr:FtsQ-type POTRA domain-containing protein [bacterium]
MLRLGLIIGKLLVTLLTVALLGYGSYHYANSIDLFSLQKVVVAGTSLVANHEVLKISGVKFGSSLFHLPLDSIQQRIVDHPYIQAVQISRQFPRTMFIQVMERDPIAYLNHGDFSCVDQYGVIIPVPRRERTLSLPVLSGFDELENLQPGFSSSDQRLLR